VFFKEGGGERGREKRKEEEGEGKGKGHDTALVSP
jgi:hypothetical protein